MRNNIENYLNDYSKLPFGWNDNRLSIVQFDVFDKRLENELLTSSNLHLLGQVMKEI